MNKITINGKTNLDVLSTPLMICDFEDTYSNELPYVTRETLKGERNAYRDRPNYYAVKDSDSLIKQFALTKENKGSFSDSERGLIESWLYDNPMKQYKIYQNTVSVVEFNTDNSSKKYDCIVLSIAWRICGKSVIGCVATFEFASPYGYTDITETFSLTDTNRTYTLKLPDVLTKKNYIYPVVKIQPTGTSLNCKLCLKNIFGSYGSSTLTEYQSGNGTYIFDCKMNTVSGFDLDEQDDPIDVTYESMGWDTVENIEWLKIKPGDTNTLQLINTTLSTKATVLATADITITYRIEERGLPCLF